MKERRETHAKTESPLMIACKRGDIEQIQSAIENAKEQNCLAEMIATLDSHGLSVFHHLLRANQLDLFNILLKHELDALKAHFDESEDCALKALERLYQIYPEIISSSEHLFYFSDRKETPLYFAARSNYYRLAKRLLEMRVDPDRGVDYYKDSNNALHLASPLIRASYSGFYEGCEILLSNNANIMHVTNVGVSALMVTSELNVAQLLLAASRAKGRLSDFVSLKTKRKIDAGSYQCEFKNASIVHELISLPNCHDMLDITAMLKRARAISATSSEESAEFDAICLRLRSYIKIYPPLTFSTPPATRLRHKSAYYDLFKSEPLTDSKLTVEKAKTQALKSLIAQYCELLNSPAQCMDFLRFLNNELKRYYQNKHQEPFPVLDKTDFEFQPILDLYYPIPKPGYKGIKKQRALAELLIALFRKHGLAEKAYKWIGFIPQELADEHVKEGYFFTEGTYGTGLCHGKLAHMLQRALLIYAVEQGRIDRFFIVDRKRYVLDFKDILESLVSIKSADGNPLWMRTQDVRTTNYIRFTDPFRLVSTIMHDGHNQGLDALANSLTDSFCKGFNAYLRAYREHTPFADLAPLQFIQHLGDLTLNLFSFNPRLFDKEVKEVLLKRNLGIGTIDSGEKYALPPKTYEPDPFFEPSSFGYSNN